MTEARAGFGVSSITPRVGAELAGYRYHRPSAGVHDELHSRALVMEGDGSIWALSTNELCWIGSSAVALIRKKVAERTPIPESNIFVCAVHTHSGPRDDNAEDWDRPLADLVADAIVQAYENRVPARVGTGRGRLDEWSINRRFIDRSTDPGMAVLKVEDLNGTLLGTVVNWNCHAVVLGYDNLLISADFPGLASAQLEEQMGDGAVALYINGGAGDVNPLTSGVQDRLSGEYAVDTHVPGHCYYGTAEAKPRFRLCDRGGGTFEEAEALGQAVAQEAWKITRTIQVGAVSRAPWIRSAHVQIRPARAPAIEVLGRETWRNWTGKAEIMALGVDELAMIGEPGEVFCETALLFKRRLWQMGFGVPMTSGYANGYFSYLPPSEAFAEGGYEVEWARKLSLREDLQTAMWEAIEGLIPHVEQQVS
ncbi:MAG: hypothetical protein GX620_17685 [Chloroflexi bacterium]|nr:hypothetical protein [Chloroflexota bacterium]